MYFVTLPQFSGCLHESNVLRPRVYVCDMLENELYELPSENGCFEYTYGGFEIVTFKLV